MLRPMILVLCCLLLLVSAPLAAQEQPDLRRFRVVLTSGVQYEGKDGRLESGRLRGVASDGQPLEFPLGDVLALEVRSGGRVAKGFLLGALAGGAIMAAAVLQVSADPELELDTGRVAVATSIFMGVGGLIGAGVGAATRTWRPVQLPRNSLLEESPLLRVTLLSRSF